MSEGTAKILQMQLLPGEIQARARHTQLVLLQLVLELYNQEAPVYTASIQNCVKRK